MSSITSCILHLIYHTILIETPWGWQYKWPIVTCKNFQMTLDKRYERNRWRIPKYGAYIIFLYRETSIKFTRICPWKIHSTAHCNIHMVSKIKNDLLTNSIRRTEARDLGKRRVGARKSSILVLAFICAPYFQRFRNSHIILTVFFMYYAYYMNF